MPTSKTPEPPGDTPWLDDDQQAAWRSLNSLTIKLRSVLETELERSAGLNLFEYLVLSGLSEAPERTLQLSELAARADSSLSRLSHVVTRLERRGWVVRQTSPRSGRLTNAVLTDAGWAKVVESAPAHVRAVRDVVIDALDPAELAQLKHAADLVLQRLAAHGRTAPGAPAGRSRGTDCP